MSREDANPRPLDYLAYTQQLCQTHCPVKINWFIHLDQVIHMWAEKEMHNLVKMAKFGIPVPEVILLRKHVLVKPSFDSFRICRLEPS